MKTSRRFSLGWGAAAFLLTVSIVAGARLASIGVDALDIIADEALSTESEAVGVVALIEPSAVDDLSHALSPAIEAARQPGANSFATFSPGLPPFLAESAAMIETLDIARAAGVDAVVVRADRRESLDRAAGIAADGIITVAVGSLVPTASVQIRVGADPVQLADRVTKLVDSGSTGSLRVGYLCGLCSGADAPAAMRFLSRMEAQLERSEIVVQRVDDAELGSIAAAQALLEDDVDVIVCDTAEATVAVAQVVISANRVGSVRIIGFGETDRITSLVDDRVVEASVTAEYAAALDRAFQILEQMLTGSISRSSFSPERPVDLIASLGVLGSGGWSGGGQ